MNLSNVSGYFVYGSAMTAGVVMQTKDHSPVASHVPLADGVPELVLMGVMKIVDGKIFLWDIAVTDFGSIVIIILTLIITLVKSYYDFTDWRSRERSRIEEREAKLRREEISKKRKLAELEGHKIPPDPK